MDSDERYGPGDDRGRRSARQRLQHLLEARRAYLRGDINGAIGVYASLLIPPFPHADARLDLRRILLQLDQMAASDPEFRRARERIRERLVDLLEGCG
jgi:hypothetical protein